MATTTPNYGWAVPTSTDLVKDGATAIETLGDAIDASMNTALGTKKAGMVLLNTTSFSGVSSQSINDVFTSTYTNYKILLNIDSTSASPYILGRLRASGTDNTSSNYNSTDVVTNASSSGLVFTSSYGGTSWRMWGNFNPDSGTAEILVSNPEKALKTTFNSYGSFVPGAITSRPPRWFGGNATVTTSYDGLTIFPDSGTMTGSISIYGVNE
jgi:hypothetical protein